MKSILDPTFRYTPSVKTDIAKTFARIRREMAIAGERPAATNVVGLGAKQMLRARGG